MGLKSTHYFTVESYSVQDIEDSQLAKVELYVCHDKHNNNGSYISIENMIRAQDSIYRKPLLYRLNSFGSDFLEHEDKLYPAGFIDPLFNDLRYEEKNGKIYFVVSAILWKVYVSDVLEILERDGVKGISMEIRVSSTDLRNDGYVDIIDYEYLGIVLLGDDYKTGMVDTTAKIVFSKDDLNKMIKESENILKYRLEKNQMEEDIKMEKDKEVVEVVEKVEETVETFKEVEKEVEEVTETIEETKEFSKEDETVEIVEIVQEDEVVEEVKQFSEEVVEEPKEDLKEMVFSLNEKVKTLEKEISEKDSTIEVLAKFKADRESELRVASVSALFTKFSETLNKTEMEEWKEKEVKYSSFEDFEKDISKFVLDKIYADINIKKETFAKMHVPTVVEEDEVDKVKSVWDKIAPKKK